MNMLLTVTRKGVATAEEDAQGNPAIGPDTSFPLVVRAVAPTSADESADPTGPRVITGYQVYGYKNQIPLLPTDRLTIRGVAGWQVEGEAGLWESAFGTARGGTEFAVRRSG